MSDKRTLRTELLERRKRISDRSELSELAAKNAAPLIPSGNVLVYIPIGAELDISSLIDALLARGDTELYVPHTVGEEITPQRLCRTDRLSADNLGNLTCGNVEYGNNDTDSIKFDCCVVPLVGFNSRGYRIGYGKGCYDRFFAKYKVDKRIGVGFSCQQGEFAEEEFDVPLDICVTEKNVIYF